MLANGSGRSGRSVCIDCRWIGLGGPGRVTELLLRGLREIEPDGRWILWGRDDALEPFRWQGTEVVHSSHDPRTALGQRQLHELPRAGLWVFMHHTRPLRPGPSVTVIHDTIPLRHGGLWAVREAKRAFLKMAVALSSRVITDSDYSKRSIVRDVGVDHDKITALPLPVDDELSERIRARRAHSQRKEVALYVGRFPAYKNLPRLADAFRRTNFAAKGGELLCVGGTDAEIASLGFIAGPGMHIEGPCSPGRLEELYATSRMLILPSLEEGFGLPLWEAMACGLPACASRTGSIPEIADENVYLFDPYSVEEIAGAIDATASGSLEIEYTLPKRTPADYAEAFLQQIRRVV